MGDSTTKERLHFESPVGRLARNGPQASNVLVQERNHCSLAVVIERSVTLYLRSFPILPNGGGSCLDHVNPRRGPVLQEEFEGNVGMSVVRQDRQKEGCGKKSRTDS